MKYLKALGCPFLNLGGGVAENTASPSSRSASARPGDRRCPKQVYDWEAFERLCRFANLDPDTQTDISRHAAALTAGMGSSN
jgi:hypothetical protein